MQKQVRIEKVCDRDAKAITELFNCGDCRAVVAPADNVVHRRLCNAAAVAQGVNRYIMFPA